MFILSAAVTLVPWVLVDRLHVHPFYILAGVAIASNGPHLVSTWSRVYFDREERRRRPLVYFAAPLAIAGGVLGFLVLDGSDSPWLRTILFYWASWHFAAQCWGLLRIYQRKHGVAELPIARVEKALLFGGAGWCVLHRLFTGPWSLFGVPIWHPRPPAWLVNGVGAAVATLAIAYVVARVAQWRRGLMPDFRRPALIASTIGAFAVPFLLIRDGTAAFAAAACWHGFQYIGIVWFYNANRWREGVSPSARLVSWLSQPRRAALYLLALVAIAGVAYATVLGASRLFTFWSAGTWGLFVWSSLTFGHYFLDGMIWKLRRDPTVRERLQTA